MRNVLVVTAHPELTSFNFALTDAAAEVLHEEGAQVRQTRLYQDSFALAPGRGDFVRFPSDQPLRLLRAQRAAERYGGFVPQILREQDSLAWLDILLLQFPLWWGTYPAILKGWIERVLTYGFAYGRSATLPKRDVVLSVTTGGADSPEEEQGYQERLDRMADDVFGYMGWRIHPHLITHAPDTASGEERSRLLEAHRAGVRSLLQRSAT